MPKRRALAVGVDNYNYTGIVDLKGAGRDASNLAGFLANVSMRDRFQVDLLLSPTAEEVFKALRAIRDELKNEPDPVFVFYFAGHGTRYCDGNSQVLLCRDADEYTLDGTTDSGAISPKALGRVKDEIRGNKFFCFDVCRSQVERRRAVGDVTGNGTGLFRDAFLSRQGLAEQNVGNHDNFWMLSSCDDRERASDDGEFAQAMIETMRNSILDRGCIELGDAFVQSVAARLGSKTQHPTPCGRPFVLWGERARVGGFPPPPPPQETLWFVAGSNTPIAESALMRKIASGELGAVAQIYSQGTGWTTVGARFPQLVRKPEGSFPPPPPRAGLWGEDPARRAGTAQELTIAGVKYRFRWCPAGTFMMGSPKSEKWRRDRETQHRVTLSRGYWMMETPATQRMWRSLTGENPSAFCEDGEYASDVSGLNTDDFPVESVSWEDVQGFIETLNARDELQAGMRFRLPTEAEWEYACRAGQNYKYSGSNDLAEVGWYEDNSDVDDNGGRTHKVGTKKANGWGLYDMSGNVDEWCNDWYDEDYYADNSVVDPKGPNSGSFRVSRGGSWDIVASYCRCAYRDSRDPGGSWDYVGFRLLLESVE